MTDCDLILPELFVGSHPRTSGDIERLSRTLGVKAVLNMQTDEDMETWGINWATHAAQYERRGVEVARVPIRDFDRLDLRKKLPDAVRVLNQLLVRGHTVYTHCTAGVGRAPAVVIAYLHWCRGWELERAVNHVTSRRSCAPNVEAIFLATRDLLRDEVIQREINHRAASYIKDRLGTPEEKAQVWARAEREVLQESLSRPYTR